MRILLPGSCILPTKACYYWHYLHWSRPFNIIVHYCRTESLLLDENVTYLIRTRSVVAGFTQRFSVFDVSEVMQVTINLYKLGYWFLQLISPAFPAIYGICLRYYIIVNSKRPRKYHSGVDHFFGARFHSFELPLWRWFGRMGIF